MASGSGGSRTLGRYELLTELAKGQLGALWAGKTVSNEGEVQLAMIRRVPTSAPVTPAEIDQLSEGAWWAMELIHPTIARTRDVMMQDGELGVAMEYVEGEVLRSLLRLASFKRKVIPVPIGLRIALDVLDALGHAADEAPPPNSGGRGGSAFGGFVPDSVLVATDGRARLLDAGIAGPSTQVGPLSRHPEMAAYSAPEQLDSAALDVRANLYAVGVMLWEILAGKRLFVGSTQSAVADKVRGGASVRLDATKPVGGDAISASVADVVQKSIHRSVDERYQTPEAFAQALTDAGPVASHAEVAAFVEELASNTLSARRKILERSAAMKPALGAITAKVSRPAAQAPPRQKQTLLGIAPVASPPPPPPPRPPIDSIDPEVLEAISIQPDELMDAPSVDVPPPPMTGFSGSDASPKPPAITPKPPESAEADVGTQNAADSAAPTQRPAVSPFEADTLAPGVQVDALVENVAASTEERKEAGTHLTTQLLGTPVIAAGADDPPVSMDLADITDDAPVSMDISDLAESVPAPAGPPPFRMGSAPDDKEDALGSSPTATGSSPEAAPKPEESKSDAAAAAVPVPVAEKDDKPSKGKDSAVAWIGPPPGEALDDEELPAPIPSMRAQQARKSVTYVMMGLGGLIVVGVLFVAFGGKDETDAPEPTPTPVTEPVAKEEPKKEEPEPVAKEEPKEEPEPVAKEEPKEEPEAEPEKPAAAPKPVPVYRPPAPRPKPRPKPKPTFTPQGI